jgi:hypothetical protein
MSLRTLLLAVAVLGVWLALLSNYRRNEQLRLSIDGLRVHDRRLRVDNPAQVVAVPQHALWMDDSRWLVHVPRGAYELALATHQIPPNVTDDQVSVPALRAVTVSGDFELAFTLTREDGGWRIRVTRDGQPLLDHLEPAEWNADRGWGSSRSGSASGGRPDVTSIILLHRVFSVPVAGSPGLFQTPDRPDNGILLWIRRKPAAAPADGHRDREPSQ